MTKSDLVLRHLRDFNTISEPEALKNYEVKNLEPLIRRIRTKGYTVKKRVETERNLYDEQVNVYHYDLVPVALHHRKKV